VLKVEERNEKALYRRAQAHLALQELAAAAADAAAAAAAAPRSAAARALQARVAAARRRYDRTQRQRLAKFFRDQKEKGLALCDH
jgi:hypothetical protein